MRILPYTCACTAEGRTTARGQILIIEDDADIREAVRVLLQSEDYTVLEAPDGLTGLNLLDDTCDLVILDVMMPGMSGVDTCREIRRRQIMVPILFLSAKSQDSDKTLGLLSGGDDYLAKPFSYSELLARVNALTRRYHSYQGKPSAAEMPNRRVIVRGDFELDKEHSEVRVDGVRIDLTDTEFGIAQFLAQHPGTILSAAQIYEAVWNEPYDRSTNGTLMVHISRLRAKIEADPHNPRHFKTVWGRGYRFE